jgi:hypothetical protein
MGPPGQKKKSLVTRFTRFVERRLGILVIAGIVLAALGGALANVERVLDFWGKYFSSAKTNPRSEASATPSPRRNAGSLQNGGGSFGGFEWRFPQRRGLVKILEEKITLFSGPAEALIWIDGHEQRDFRFSCAVELVSGDSSLGFGPVFWLRDERNFFHFAVRTDKNYRLVRYRDGQLEELVSWTPSQKVRQVGTRQNLEVVARGKSIDLFIDGSALGHYELGAEQVQSGHFGVYATEGGLNVAVTQAQLGP